MGIEDAGESTRACLAKHVLKVADVLKMLDDPSNATTKEALRQNVYRELLGLVTPQQMLETCDAAGISRKGYEAVYRTLTVAHRAKGFHQPILPTPYSVSMAKISENSEVARMLGGYNFVNDCFTLPNAKTFEYNQFNNVYIDVIKLQQAMVRYYGITEEECDGKLIFVIKLDECQVVKGQRLERVSLTLMNRALQGVEIEPISGDLPEVTGTDRPKRAQQYFGVQSEKNIWWLAAFALPHESHDSLTWYFHRTSIPGTISQQENGAELEVPEIGSFQVEWHMAGDLKTLKCMFGCKLGAGTLHPCIYCLHSRVEGGTSISTDKKGGKGAKKTGKAAAKGGAKKTAGQEASTSTNKKGGKGRKRKAPTNGGAKKTMDQDAASNTNTEANTRPATEWFQGIHSCDNTLAPSRHEDDPTWDPVLAIPLTRVHICTLHARLRILDKLLKLHINYAWNMEPAERREACIHQLEAVLSSAGLHHGAVHLRKDGKLSGSTQNNPGKVCMGGSKARHLLSNHTLSKSHLEFDFWKKVCDVTTYIGSTAETGLKRAKVWESVNTMVQLMEKARPDEDEIQKFKDAIDVFTQDMVNAWGETHITHYMVS